MIEEASVRSEIGARCTADRLLIHAHQAVHGFHACDDLTARRHIGRGEERILFVVVSGLDDTTQAIRDEFRQRLADQTRLAGSGHACDRGEAAKRKSDVETMQVVAGDVGEPQPAARRAGRTQTRRGPGKKMVARLRRNDRREAGGRPAVDHVPTGFAGSRADVDQPVGPAHHLQIVFDDEQRVAGCLETLQGGEKRFAIGRMEPRGRFVEHIDDAEQLRRQLGRKPQALQFTRGERRRAAFQCEIAETQVDERREALEQFGGDPLSGEAFFFREIRRAPHIRRRLVR